MNQVASVSEELVKYVVENDIEDLATVPAIVVNKHYIRTEQVF